MVLTYENVNLREKTILLENWKLRIKYYVVLNNAILQSFDVTKILLINEYFFIENFIKMRYTKIKLHCFRDITTIIKMVRLLQK